MDNVLRLGTEKCVQKRSPATRRSSFGNQLASIYVRRDWDRADGACPEKLADAGVVPGRPGSASTAVHWSSYRPVVWPCSKLCALGVILAVQGTGSRRILIE